MFVYPDIVRVKPYENDHRWGGVSEINRNGYR
jgi:hypothetical protein